MSVSIKGMENKVPHLVRSGLTALLVLQGSGGSVSLQGISNVVGRITGPIPGFTSQPQTVLGTPGWNPNAISTKLPPIIIAAITKFVYKYIPNFAFKGKMGRFVVNPVTDAVIAAGVVNIILGDPAGPTTNLGNIGQAAGRTTLGAYPRVVRSTGTGLY